MSTFNDIQLISGPNGAFYEDSCWNQVSADKGEEEAKRILSSLKDCYHCVDCEDCIGCVACNACSGCVKCFNCTEAKNCDTCYYSSDIRNCKMCHTISHLNEASGKTGEDGESWTPDKLEAGEMIQNHNTKAAAALIGAVSKLGTILTDLSITSREWDEIAKMPNETFSEMTKKISDLTEDLNEIKKSSNYFKWLQVISALVERL